MAEHVRIGDINEDNQLKHLRDILRVTAETAKALIEADEAELGSELLTNVSRAIHEAVEAANK